MTRVPVFLVRATIRPNNAPRTSDYKHIAEFHVLARNSHIARRAVLKWVYSYDWLVERMLSVEKMQEV